ncbi:MAG: hypothetical protein QM762_02215 [Chryseolinea sp.]
MTNRIRLRHVQYLAILVLVIFSIHTSIAQSDANAEDAGWPRQVENEQGKLVYYQPQVDEWRDKKEIYARMAFALTPKGGQEALGVASFHASTIVDKDDRTVYIRDISSTGVRFPSLKPDEQDRMQKLFGELVPKGGEPVSLDRLMADVHDDAGNSETVKVNNDPPVIFYSEEPAILLMVEGEPVLAPVEKNTMQFVVNTNWDLFFDKSKKTYFLLANDVWATSKSMEGPWSKTTTLPKDMSKLPAGENFDDVKKMIPPKSTNTALPKIFFSNKPAELLAINGKPVYSKIDHTDLLYVANTDNDIFLEDLHKVFYVLLSGRWFSSTSMNGPWKYAGDKLPQDFSNIPDNSPKADVLVFVPGTTEAADAVLLAQVPTTAVVNKAEAESKVKVNYDGDPQFKPIEGTSMQYASNTQEKIIKVGDLYYLCFQAVWFMSTTPNGPWKTADSVPKEIYSIPSNSPVYNVTYVTQTNATSTTVESNTTAGYFGMFIMGAVVGATIAYGTGYYYPPYIYWGPHPYPVYRPWPVTYGVGAVYNPWTGGFAVGRTAYGPYGAAHTAAWYNPATGRYGRSASVQGWYGGRSAASSYNPWTGSYAHTQQGHNPYGQWGSSVATHGNQWVQTGHVTTRNGTTAGYNTSTGAHGVVHTGANGTVVHSNTGNNIYAGKDGNVYRKDANDNWSKYDKNGQWNTVNRSNNVGGQGGTQRNLGHLDQSEGARQRGELQSRQFAQHRGAVGRFHR